MPTLITAGDATTGLTQTGGNDGALTIQTGPAGSKVSAIALSSAGAATFSQITGGALTLATAQATTSGTSIDFTSIPSWVKRITVMFNGVSTTGTSPEQIQIGSGSFVTSGYNGTYWFSGGGGGTFTTGFGIKSSSATDTFYGQMVLSHMGGNLWCASGTVGILTAGISGTMGATLQLSGVLDRVRLTTVGGTDTFDAGSVNIMYEG